MTTWGLAQLQVRLKQIRRSSAHNLVLHLELTDPPAGLLQLLAFSANRVRSDPGLDIILPEVFFHQSERSQPPDELHLGGAITAAVVAVDAFTCSTGEIEQAQEVSRAVEAAGGPLRNLEIGTHDCDSSGAPVVLFEPLSEASAKEFFIKNFACRPASEPGLLEECSIAGHSNLIVEPRGLIHW